GQGNDQLTRRVHLLTIDARTDPPHEMSYPTIEKLQYGQSQAQESLSPRPHLPAVTTHASTHFVARVLMTRHMRAGSDRTTHARHMRAADARAISAPLATP